MNPTANNNAATVTEPLFASVAAAAMSTSATEAQRAAAMQYLASLINIGAPGAADTPAPAPAAAPAPATPAAAAPPPFTVTPAGLPPSFAAATAGTIGTAGTVAPFAAGILYDAVPGFHLHDFGILDNGRPWYTVIRGKKVGITQDHNLAAGAVLGVSNNGWRGHKTLPAALFEFNHALDLGLVEVRPF
ncbi:hypothetical protein C8R46DRAFT_1220516 [Mycena filopes]|nr:hypothetical protein C8R46DRAFT_1220516 [Mycena filopes]